MKTIQKLEIGFGLATLFSTLALVSLFFFQVIGKELADHDWDAAARHSVSILFFLLLPPILVGTGAIIHASRQNIAGLLSIFLGGAILVFQFGMGLLTGVVFYFFGWVGGVIATTPALFALATVFAAMKSNKLLNAK